MLKISLVAGCCIASLPAPGFVKLIIKRYVEARAAPSCTFILISTAVPEPAAQEVLNFRV